MRRLVVFVIPDVQFGFINEFTNFSDWFKSVMNIFTYATDAINQTS